MSKGTGRITWSRGRGEGGTRCSLRRSSPVSVREADNPRQVEQTTRTRRASLVRGARRDAPGGFLLPVGGLEEDRERGERSGRAERKARKEDAIVTNGASDQDREVSFFETYFFPFSLLLLPTISLPRARSRAERK